MKLPYGCPGNGTFHSLGSIGKNKLCTVCFQNVSTLNTHGHVLAGKEITAHEEKQMLSAVYLNTILLEPA